MKPLVVPTIVRWSLQGAALLVAFSLGAWMKSSSTPRAEAGPAPGDSGRFAPVPVSPARTTPQVVSAQAAARQPLSALVSPAVLSVPGPTSRLAALMSKAAQMDARQTLTELHRLTAQGSGPEERAARQVLIARYAELDPETALTFVDTLSGEEHGLQRVTALTAWAAKDPAAAAEHLEQQLENGGLAGDDDAQAVAAIAGEWGQRDPLAAWQWVISLSEEARAGAITKLAKQTAASNPQQTLQLVQSLPDRADRAAAMQPLAATWAETNPVQMAGWVTSLSRQEEQASAANGLVSAWMVRDPMSASKWVTSLPTGSLRDAAIRAMVTAPAMRNDPESATLWAATVQDAALRQQLVNQAWQRWQYQDASAANQWATRR